MKKIRRIATLALVIAALIGGGYWYQRGHITTAKAATSSGTYTEVVAVKEGTLSSTISVVGQLEAVQSANLAFEHMNGATSVKTLTVNAGSVVTAGQVLATIDATAYRTAVDQAKSALAASEKTLADLNSSATALQIAQADASIAKANLKLQQAQAALDKLVNPDMLSLQAAVASAQSALAKAQATLLAQQTSQSYADQLAKLTAAQSTLTDNYNRLAAENTPASDGSYQDRLMLAYNKMMDAQAAAATYELNAQLSLLQAQMSVRSAEQALANAQEALATAQAGGDKLAVASATVAVQDAGVALQVAQKAKADLAVGTDATAIATAQADVDKKKLALSDAQAALDGTTLVAPFAGTVLQTNVSVGGQVSANTTILTVADLKSVQVVASIDETTIKNVAAGQEATITFDAYAGQTFTGKVQSVPLQGSLQGGVMVYSVPVSLVGAEKVSLLVGMTANVKIQAGTAANVLVVPAMALTKSGGQYQVTVQDATGGTVTTPVQVGLSDGTYTQITKGLNLGDQVVVQMKSSTTSSGSQGSNNASLASSLSRMFGGR